VKVEKKVEKKEVDYRLEGAQRISNEEYYRLLAKCENQKISQYQREFEGQSNFKTVRVTERVIPER
jgi:hypothetical protein